MKTSTKRSIDDCLTLKDDLLITSREANDTEKIGIFFTHFWTSKISFPKRLKLVTCPWLILNCLLPPGTSPVLGARGQGIA